MKRLSQKKLKPELEHWQKMGFLNSEQSEKILALYPKSNVNWWVYVFSILGGVLLVSGVVLIIASNWQKIPSLIKFSGLLILLMGSFIFSVESQYRSRHRARWELGYLCASIFPLLGMMLISQIFHVHGKATFLFLSWLLAIGLLPYLTRSVSTFVIFLLGIAICLISAWIDFASYWTNVAGERHYADVLCFMFFGFGVLIIFLSQFWKIFKEERQQSIGEYVGWLALLLTGYDYGFVVEGRPEFVWVLVWFSVFLLALWVIYRGFSQEKVHTINLGFVFVGLIILSFFIRLVGTMLKTGLLFIVGGVVFIGLSFLLQHLRKRLLGRMI